MSGFSFWAERATIIVSESLLGVIIIVFAFLILHLINVSVFARGLLKRLATRIYFPDEEEANAADPVLSSIDDPDARQTLVATERDGILRFDIHLQGERQTTFFLI